MNDLLTNLLKALWDFLNGLVGTL